MSMKTFVNNYNCLFVKNKRFTIVNGKYKLDRWLFKWFMGLVISLLLFSTIEFFVVDNHYYASCSEDAPIQCRNPFYKSCTGELKAVCEQEFIIKGGSIGTQPTYLTSTLEYNVLALLIAYFLINHFWHNNKGDDKT